MLHSYIHSLEEVEYITLKAYTFDAFLQYMDDLTKDEHIEDLGLGRLRSAANYQKHFFVKKDDSKVINSGRKSLHFSGQFNDPNDMIT